MAKPYIKPLLVRMLEDLDDGLVKLNVKPFEINVIGGFALLLQGIRQNTEAYTDIDYYGMDFKEKLRDLVEEIASNYGVANDWFNNNNPIEADNLDDYYLMYGDLSFEPIDLGLKIINVNVLKLEGLLNMKTMAASDFVDGLCLNRYKDIEDIRLLFERMNIKSRAEYESYLNPEIAANSNTKSIWVITTNNYSAAQTAQYIAEHNELPDILDNIEREIREGIDYDNLHYDY